MISLLFLIFLSETKLLKIYVLKAVVGMYLHYLFSTIAMMCYYKVKNIAQFIKTLRTLTKIQSNENKLKKRN
jgi:hypothetical protein